MAAHNIEPAYTPTYSSWLNAIEAHFTSLKTYAEVLAGGFVDVKDVAPGLRRRLRRGVGDLLERAQEAGTAREDVSVPEVMALLVGAVRAAEHAGRDRELRDRIVAIFLDGLRPARGR
jgi:hypothetical protein